MSEQDWVQLGKRLKLMMKLREIYMGELAKKAYIEESVISLLIRGSVAVTPEMWTRIRKALSWPVWLDGQIDLVLAATYEQDAPSKVTTAPVVVNYETAAPTVSKAKETTEPAPTKRPMGRPRTRDVVGEAVRDIQRRRAAAAATERTPRDEVDTAMQGGSISGRVVG